MKPSTYPSDLPFASLLQYVPRSRATTPVDRLSATITYAVKDDRNIRVKRGSESTRERAIDFLVRRLANKLDEHEFLERYVGDSTTLVPMPGRAPLVSKDALWSPLRICESLCEHGLGGEVIEAVKRVTPVEQSSRAKPGERPNPPDHFASLEVEKSLLTPEAVTLVDDVVTRGSTFVGAVARLHAEWPGVEVRCLALVRTSAGAGFEAQHEIFVPVEGKIEYVDGWLNRSP